MNGRMVHFEIPFDDGDRARSFYGDVFGWKTQELPGMDYTMALTGPVGEDGMSSEAGYINGGMFQRQEKLNIPLLTINVDSIEETVAQVESHGGTTVEAKEAVGDMGFVAYVTDSEGNLIGIWENAS